MLVARLPLHLYEFLNTSLTALKKIQYKIAMKTIITVHNTAPNIQRKSPIKIVTTIQRTILNIIPTIPSSTSVKSAKGPAKE